MFNLWHILQKRSARPIMRSNSLHYPACSASFEKPTSIISVVEYKKPLTVPIVLQPIMNEFEYVCFQVLSSRYLDVICDFMITLFETGGVARMYPENPDIWRLDSAPVGELDSKL